MMAPAYLRRKDIDKAKKKNRMIKFKNMFRGSDKKEELIPITETKEQIKKEVKEQAMALLKRIDWKIKGCVSVYTFRWTETACRDYPFHGYES